ncbi:hypothetical protein [Marinobacter mobilis]|uniref:Uncharacterized protein n=1 Tax=Marinobacter mobilis TaxID=488533 RepID=A0A1H2XZQ1_9GAMM|nr:hypothetical protein [Marinobacter mobilis]SDW98205.1 hypothetical protein SAMN04487960_105209 [Marinobacter mobilis]
MTFSERLMRYLLTVGSTAVLLLMSVVANADNELDVTMRMVTDDEALSGGFVQQLELPELLNDMEAVEFGIENLGQELAADALEVGREAGDTLAEQSRESRDALDTELPGEGVDTSPELDLPILEDPGLDLPILEDPDLPLINEDNLTDGNLLDDPLIDGKL